MTTVKVDDFGREVEVELSRWSDEERRKMYALSDGTWYEDGDYLGNSYCFVVGCPSLLFATLRDALDEEGPLSFRFERPRQLVRNMPPRLSYVVERAERIRRSGKLLMPYQAPWGEPLVAQRHLTGKEVLVEVFSLGGELVCVDHKLLEWVREQLKEPFGLYATKPNDMLVLLNCGELLGGVMPVTG